MNNQTNNRIREEIEEEFIEILEYGKNLTGEEVWTDLDKMQWLRKKIDELLKSQRNELMDRLQECAWCDLENGRGKYLLESDIINLIKNN